MHGTNFVKVFQQIEVQQLASSLVWAYNERECHLNLPLDSKGVGLDVVMVINGVKHRAAEQVNS